MKSLDLNDQESKLQQRLEQDERLAADAINRVAPQPADEAEERTFTLPQVQEVIRVRLAMERNEDPAQRLQQQEMWLRLRMHLNSHDLPAQEFMDVFQRMDPTTFEGLCAAVEDIIWLSGEIVEYAKQVEIQRAARQNMPIPKETDYLRKVFGLDN